MGFELGQSRGRTVVFSPGVVLRPGRYKCRLVVRDMDTGEAAVAKSHLAVGKPGEKNLSLGQPLLLVRGSAYFYPGGKTPEAKTRQELTDIYSFDCLVFRPLLGPLPKEAPKILALVPFCRRGLSPGEIKYKAHAVSLSSQQSVPISCTELECLPKAGFQVQSLELGFGHLEPGEYALYVIAQDASTKETAYTQTPLVVR
jgi:hypothetical protein